VLQFQRHLCAAQGRRMTVGRRWYLTSVGFGR
jgi:hypothetical protein